MRERQSLPGVLDIDTYHAVRTFLTRLAGRYHVTEGILYGSRARQAHTPDSDADLVVVLLGALGDRREIRRDLAGLAFDVLLETGILVDALPLWEHELAHPDTLENSALVHAIYRDGLRLPAAVRGRST